MSPRAAAKATASMRFVALLRGINVGKAKRVPMAELRRVLEAQGFNDVRTLLASGNAVFGAGAERSSAQHAETIAAVLRSDLGVEVRVIVRSSPEFMSAVAGAPVELPAAEHPRYLVAFAQDVEGLQGLKALLPLQRHPERLEIGSHAAYLHCANGILESPIASAMLGRHGRAVTTRNWATVLKIQAMLA